MKNIVCGKENATAFNAALRQHTPAFFDLAKALYQSGLITGLSGATLSTDTIENYKTPTKLANDKKCCRDCRHWLIDTVGDGSGIGACLVDGNKKLHKWPAQTACQLFEEIISD